MKIIDETLLNEVTMQAKESPRLRMRSVIESVVLCAEEGRYGVDIPKGVWHTLESLERGYKDQNTN